MPNDRTNQLLTWRIYFVSILLLAGAAGTIWLSERLDGRPVTSQGMQPTTIAALQSPLANNAPKRQVIGLPALLIIPRLNLTSKIEHVGLNSSGQLGLPTDDQKVAWYKLGYKPGQKGSAVIAGQAVSPSGHAVFCNLADLTRGDTVTVTYDNGHQYDFSVDSLTVYTQSQVPLQQLLTAAEKPTLNLIAATQPHPAGGQEGPRLVASASLIEPSE